MINKLNFRKLQLNKLSITQLTDPNDRIRKDAQWQRLQSH